MSGRIRAGVARADITPPVGIAHAGWGAQSHERAEGIDAPFFVTALALADDDATCLIVELDTGLLMVEDASLFREAIAEAVGVPPGNIRVSYSHTHAGPILQAVNVKAGNELIESYWGTMRSGAIGAAREAISGLRPARLGAAYAQSDIATNRRFETPDGRVVVSQAEGGFNDPTVTAVRIDGEDGAPLASIVGYACHPITLAFQNRLLSPDFPGVVREVVEQLTGSMCLFLQGAAGDQMPSEGLTGDLSVHRRLGKRLGASAAEALLGIDTERRSWTFDRVVESGAPLGLRTSSPAAPDESGLRVATRIVEMPLRDAVDKAKAEAARDLASAELARLRAAGIDVAAIRDGMFRAKRAEMRVWFASLYGGMASAPIEIHGLRVGPLALVGFPGEPFALTGAHVRERSPAPVTLFSGYSNGWAGYVPTQDQFARGGYEVEIGSHFAAGAAEVLEDAAVHLIEETLVTSSRRAEGPTRWWTLRWPDFERLDRDASVVLVPFGSIEQHGPHLQLDEDIQNALALAELASAASTRPVLVAPPVWWGLAPHHMGYPGTISLRLETVSALVRDICASIASHGFRRILLVNGHGGNAAALAATTIQLSADLKLFVSSTSYWSLIPDVLAEVGTSEIGGMGHAGEMETSMALYLRPDSVAVDRLHADIPRGGMDAIDFRHPGPVTTPLDLAADTREGVMGDPTLATREKGAAIVAATVERLVAIIEELAARTPAAEAD